MVSPDKSLQRPNKQYALERLEKYFDHETSNNIWKEAIGEVNQHQEPTDFEDLKNVFHYLSQQPGKVGVLGMSLRMRLMAYQNQAVVSDKRLKVI